MAEAYVFLADGFEEVEGLTVVDMLRRAGIKTDMVSITGRKQIIGSHKIAVEADVLFEKIDPDSAELFVLPGGMPGTTALAAHEGLGKLLCEQAAAGKKIAAICAAPTVLGSLGLLKGRPAVCYPGMEDQLTGADVRYDEVQVSGNIITSRGVGTALQFGFTLTELMRGRKAAEQLAKSVVSEYE